MIHKIHKKWKGDDDRSVLEDKKEEVKQEDEINDDDKKTINIVTQSHYNYQLYHVWYNFNEYKLQQKIKR